MTTKCKSAIIWQLEVSQKVYLRSVSFWVESLGSLTYRITFSAKRYTLTSFPMCVSLSSFVFLFQLRLQALYWLERVDPLVLFLETGSLIVLVLVGLGISLGWPGSPREPPGSASPAMRLQTHVTRSCFSDVCQGSNLSPHLSSKCTKDGAINSGSIPSKGIYFGTGPVHCQPPSLDLPYYWPTKLAKIATQHMKQLSRCDLQAADLFALQYWTLP